MASDEKRVFTIGHSTMDLKRFLALLEKAEVTAIADVRSSPFSRRFPHFSQGELRAALKKVGVKYSPLGKELGGRPRAGYLYCEGIADYEKMALEPEFIDGIGRVIKGSKEHTIALMCSEHDPLDCHRCLLVGRALATRDVPLNHILGSGRVIGQHELEERLLSLSGDTTLDMFASREERLAVAYRDRAKVVAYRLPPPTQPDATAQNEHGHAF